MKKLLFFLLFQGSLDCYTQFLNPHYKYVHVNDSTYKKITIKPDTVRASLLITRKRMTIAFNYEGHAVIKNGRVVEFLDDRKRLFPAHYIVWSHRIKL
jgi:hypothetical protein